MTKIEKTIMEALERTDAKMLAMGDANPIQRLNPKVLTEAPAPKKHAPSHSLTDLKKILGQTGQREIMSVMPAMIQTLLEPNNSKYYSLLLLGPAGSGKDFAANVIAEALGWEVARPNTLEDLYSMVGDKCALTSQQGTVWFINECHTKKGLTERLKEFVEPANGDYASGGDKENPWTWLPHRNLVVLGSNKGCGDVAWIGQGGRAHILTMLPLTKEQKVNALRTCLAENGMEFPASKTAWDFLLDFSADYWRPLKMRIECIALKLRSDEKPASLENVRAIMKESGMSRRGFMRHEMKALRALAANPKGLQMKALTALFNQADDLVRASLAALAEHEFVTVALTGASRGLQCITEKGMRFLMEVDGINPNTKGA